MVHTTATTLHYHYDLERSGYHGTEEKKNLFSVNCFFFVSGYDRRHFPERQRSAVSEVVPLKRVDNDRFSSASLPGNVDEQWRPHVRHIEPMYTKYVLQKKEI